VVPLCEDGLQLIAYFQVFIAGITGLCTSGCQVSEILLPQPVDTIGKPAFDIVLSRQFLA
jgi:hypothetical protein